MLLVGDIYKLITYCTIVESFFVTMTVSGLLYMRWSQPKLVRPIKVNILVPIVFVLICVFLLVMPCLEAPYEVGMGALITLTGVPAYYVGIRWKSKPKGFLRAMGKQSVIFLKTITYVSNSLETATLACQKLFLSAHEDE